MTDNQRVKWLLVGTGDIVRKRVAPALVSASNGRCVGVVGGIERARALAGEFNIPNAYADLDAALRTTDATAVYIATPVYRHRPEALAAIAAGKHVLIEKPLGLDGDDAQAIADAAHRAGLTAGCAYYRRFYPRYQLAREMLANHAFGRVTLVRTHVSSWFNPEPSDPKFWRVQKHRSGGGILADMGCHMIDLIVGLFGKPVAASAQVGTLVHNYGVDDSAAAILRLSDNTLVVADFHWNTKTFGHEFEIVGTDARLRMSPADTGPVIRTVGRDVQTLDLPNAANVHLPLVEDFAQAVLDHRPPAVTLAEATLTNRVLDAIYRSAASGREEAV